MDIKESIEKTRRGFEETFAAGDSYNWQSRDEEHLGKILGFINIRENMRSLEYLNQAGSCLYQTHIPMSVTWKDL